MKKASRFASAVLGLIALGAWHGPREVAAAGVCSAAIEAKPVLCKVSADCPGTDLAKIQPGDPVTITGQFTNTAAWAGSSISTRWTSARPDRPDLP